MSTRISLFRALAPALLFFTAVGLAAPTQDLASLESKFRSAATSGSAAERTQALADLVALADPGAVPTMTTEYGRVSVKVRKAIDDFYRASYAHERITELIKTMELRAERDEGLKEAVSKQKEKREKLTEDMGKAQRDREKWEPWRDELGEGMRSLFEAIGKGKRKKAEGEIWEVAASSEELELRLASIELLGKIGADGTAIEMQKLFAETLADRVKQKKEMRKMDADVRKMERRLQEEVERMDGRTSAATQDQYNRAKAESSRIRRELTLKSYICDACVEAGGAALARETDKVLEKSLTTLVRSLKKVKDGGYVRMLEMLGHARTEPVQARLRELLEAEKEPLGRATLLDALAAAGDESIVDAIVSKHLADESWHVRSRAAAALAVLRVKKGIPALIAQLKAEQEGRIRTDISHALSALSGKDFRTNATLWERWWNDVGDTFEVPPADAEIEASDQTEETVGVTFFGIRTESQRVLFVLDLSGSMDFSMVPRNNPDDDIQGGREPDMPKEGEISRLTAAKRDLQKAMGGLQDDALFNVVFYASDVWPWQENKLVKMDADTRGEVTELIESLDAVGGTNIYGALKMALEMAGAKEGNEWVEPKIDTIYLLSDGRPSVGVTTDPDEILAMVTELNQNAGITIHTIGLSGAQDAYLLRSLAEQNGGTYAAR